MSGLVIALLLLLSTGMSISIALGLTVLAFLFTFSTIPIEIVSQRLFTGLDQFAIMAIPFFILSGTFLTSGGVTIQSCRGRAWARSGLPSGNRPGGCSWW